MRWMKENWDKIAMLVLGGVVGFFSSQLAMQRQLTDFAERLTKLEGGGPVLQDALVERWKAASVTLDGLVEKSRKLNDDVVPNLESKLSDLDVRTSASSTLLDRLKKIDEKAIAAVEHIAASPNVDPINALGQMSTEIRTQKLVILDEAGNDRISLHVAEPNTHLIMFDAGKNRKAELRADKSGGFIQFHTSPELRGVLQYHNGKGVNTIAN